MRGFSRLDSVLLLFVATSLGVAVVRGRVAYSEVGFATRPHESEFGFVRGDRTTWDQRMRRASANAPFLLATSPSKQVDSSEIGSAGPVVSAPTRPPITVQAIVGGPPWHAVIEGVPGTEGSIVVRQGDRLQTFFVRSVGVAGVTVGVADSSWFMPLARQGAP